MRNLREFRAGKPASYPDQTVYAAYACAEFGLSFEDVDGGTGLAFRVASPTKTVYFGAKQLQPSYVQFTVNPPQGFVIRSVSSKKHLVKPDVKKMTALDGTDSYSIEVYCVQNLPANSDGQDELDIATNDTEQPEIKIPVTLAR